MKDSWSAFARVAATGLAGIVAGCMTFASAVDARTFVKFVSPEAKEEKTGNAEDGNEELVKAFFKVWWPHGRDLMVPLLAATSLAHFAAYFASRGRSWILSGLLIMSIGPYTGIVLMEDIDALRGSDAAECARTVRRFCNLHHVRTVLAGTAFVLSLRELAGFPNVIVQLNQNY